MNKKISIRIGVAGTVLSLVMLLLSSFLLPHLIDFVRVHVVSDNHINEVGAAKIKLLFYFLVACIFFMSLLFFFNLINKLIERLPLQQWSNDISRLFYHDPLCARKKMGKHFFLISSGIAILIHLLVLTFGRPAWEGPIDHHSPLLYVVAAILLFVSISPLRKLEINPTVKRKIKWGLILVAVSCLAIYGEEVNWGQQYFEIETSDLFKLNYQQENSIHNFFNPVFYHVYSLVALGSFIVLSYLWFTNKPKGVVTQLLMPPAGLYVLFLIMAGSTYATELYELYFAVLSVLYAVRVFMCLKYPGGLFFEKEGSGSGIAQPRIHE
jgi:hypothetical protein